MPFPLKRLRTKRYAAASVILMICVSSAVLASDFRHLAPGVFSLWLYWSGFSLLRELNTGRILESRVICRSVQKAAGKESRIVTFCDADDDSAFYVMRCTGVGQCEDIAPGGRYTVFYEPGNLAVLLAYAPLN